MKKLGKFAIAALCSLLCFQGTRAGDSTNELNTTTSPARANTWQVDDVPDAGFVGLPMLSKYGYGANVGAFHLEVGQGVSNPGYLVDDNPDNYASAVGIGATVALDQYVTVSQDPDKAKEGIIIPKYHSGDVVGFVLSDGSNSGSVLNLDVVKMFVIYLYNGDQRVATINAKGSELDILGLSLISYGAGMQTIKLPVPLDKDGKDIEFDGIGIGVAGVDASVIEQVRIHYAFIDCFEEVPIIKRYFENAL